MKYLTYIKTCISNFLKRNQNPLQKLEGACTEFENMLKEMKLGVVDMVTTRNVIVFNIAENDNDINLLTAKIAENMGNDDFVKPLIRQKLHIATVKSKNEAQLETLKPKIDTMVQNVKQLEIEVDCFKLDAKLMKAEYETAKTINKINVSSTGLSTGPDVSVVDEIRQRIEEVNANSSAITELTEMDVLKNEFKFNYTVDDAEVLAELERLKTQ